MSSKKTICEYCGAENPAEAITCYACGAPLPAEESETVLSKTVSLEPEPEPEPKEEPQLTSLKAAVDSKTTPSYDFDADKKETEKSAKPAKPKKQKREKKRRESLLEVLKKEFKKFNADERERFLIALRYIAYCLPVALAVAVGFDVFRNGNGHLDEIYASSTPSLGPIIVLYILFAAAALVTAIFFIVSLHRQWADYDYVETHHNVAAIVCAVLTVALCAVNVAMTFVRDGQYQVKYIFCDRFDYEYVEKGAEIELPNTYVPEMRDAGDHYEQYYFNGWEIDGGVYPRGAKYTVKGDTDILALDGYNMFGRVEGTTTNASVSVSYFDGEKNVSISGGKDQLVPFGAELTISVYFSYDYDNDLYINDSLVRNTSNNNLEYKMTVTGNVKIRAYSEQPPMCLTEGTEVMLADGSTKPVESLTASDVLIAFDHERGEYVAAPLLVNVHAGEAARECEVVGLEFDGGARLDIVYEHALFDLTLNRYVYITAENAQEYIGHEFAAMSGAARLERATVSRRTVKVFNPATVWHINLVANGMLTMSAGMTNLFEYGDGMTYDKEKMREAIAAYGLYEYSDFADYVSPEVFAAFPFKYYKPAVEKGEFSFDKLLWLIEFYNRS